MKGVKYMVTVKFTDGTTQDFIVYEPVEVGTSYKGGKVTSCHNLKRID